MKRLRRHKVNEGYDDELMAELRSLNDDGDGDGTVVYTKNKQNTTSDRVSSARDALERAKRQSFNTGFLSNLASVDTVKEGLKGAARASIDAAGGVAKMGTGLARIVGAGDIADKIDNKIDNASRDAKYGALGSEWGDDVTRLSDYGGKLSGEAFGWAIPAGVVGKVGRLAKAAGTASKAAEAADKVAKVAKAAEKARKVAKTATDVSKKGSAAKEIAIRGLRGYGWHGLGNEIGDTLEEGGHQTAAKVARAVGTALGAKSALSPVGAKKTLISKIGFGIPAGLGVSQGVHDVSRAMEKRGIIDHDTQEKIDNAGEYVGFGVLGKPLYDMASDVVVNGVGNAMDYINPTEDDSDYEVETDDDLDNDDGIMAELNEINSL